MPQHPVRTSGPVHRSGPNQLFYRSTLFPDLDALNAAAPFGTYSGTGTNSVLGTSVSAPDVVYSEDFWPNVPMLTPIPLRASKV